MRIQSSFPQRPQKALLAVAFMALAIPSSWAQPPQRPDGPPDRPPPPPNPFMEALDTDRDHQLSAEEIANASTSLMKLDRNKNGVLEEEELRPPPPPGDQPFAGPERPARRGNRTPPDRFNGPPGPGGPPAHTDDGPRQEQPPPRPQRSGPELGGRPPADDGRQPPLPGGGPEQLVDRAFEFDADGDGLLSREELLEFARMSPPPPPSDARGGPRGFGGGPRPQGRPGNQGGPPPASGPPGNRGRSRN